MLGAVDYQCLPDLCFISKSCHYLHSIDAWQHFVLLMDQQSLPCQREQPFVLWKQSPLAAKPSSTALAPQWSSKPSYITLAPTRSAKPSFITLAPSMKSLSTGSHPQEKSSHFVEQHPLPHKLLPSPHPMSPMRQAVQCKNGTSTASTPHKIDKVQSLRTGTLMICKDQSHSTGTLHQKKPGVSLQNYPSKEKDGLLTASITKTEIISDMGPPQQSFAYSTPKCDILATPKQPLSFPLELCQSMEKGGLGLLNFRPVGHESTLFPTEIVFP